MIRRFACAALLFAAAGCGPPTVHELEVVDPQGLEFRLVTGPEDPSATEFPIDGRSIHLGHAEPFRMARVFGSADRHGFPALGFELVQADRSRFEAWTGSHVGRRLAIVIDGRVVTDPEIDEPLPGEGIIRGGALGFSEEDVRALLESMDR